MNAAEKRLKFCRDQYKKWCKKASSSNAQAFMLVAAPELFEIVAALTAENNRLRGKSL